MNLYELRQKEVINVRDGKWLGYVEDVEIDCCSGQVKSLQVPGGTRMKHFFCKPCELQIPWCCIHKIGPDVILVTIDERLYGMGK